jgi:hypothetical protein
MEQKEEKMRTMIEYAGPWANQVIALVVLLCSLFLGTPAFASPLATPFLAPWYPPTDEELMEAELVLEDVAGDTEPSSQSPVDEDSLTVATDGMSVQSGGSAPLSVDYDIADVSIRLACWAHQDPCTDAIRIAVGSARGIVYDGSTVHSPDNFVDGAGADDCGLEDSFGTARNLLDLVLYLEAVHVMDKSSTNAACFQIKLTSAEYSGNDCSGTVRRGPYRDQVEYATTGSGTEQTYAYCDDKSDCAGSWGDSCDGAYSWHLPDVLFSADSNLSGYYSYSVSVETRSCSTDCTTSCSAWTTYDEGCFSLAWTT